MMRTALRLFVPLAMLTAACSSAGDDDSSQQSEGVTGSAPRVDAPSSAPSEGAAPAAAPAGPAATPDVGAVFTISNDATANEVWAFGRAADGSLAAATKTATGGKGLGKGLGSQGALALSNDGKRLVVVDAGSSELTTFAVDGTKLTVLSRVSSHGTTPVSVAIHGDLVYVLNAGGTACIGGFRMHEDGALEYLEGSTHALSAASPGAAEVAFSPAGDALVVTEKGTNVIDTFTVDANGLASNGEALPSSGMTPFGFAFTQSGTIVVSEAFGGTVGLGATSSYRLAAPHPDGAGGVERDLVTVSGSVKNQQGAPCWVAIANDGRWAFVANTATGTVSTYAVMADGSIRVLGDGASGVTGAGTKPADLALDRSSKRLYVLDGGTHDLAIFDVAADGSLAKRAGAPALPMTAAGLVAR